MKPSHTTFNTVFGGPFAVMLGLLSISAVLGICLRRRAASSTELALIAALSLISLGHAQAQSVTVGAPGDAGGSNEYPFGFPVLAYQQVYAASDFSSPLAITGLTFFNTVYTAGTIDPATYTIDLSTTSRTVDGLSASFSSNFGSDNTTVFSGVLSGSASLSFTVPTSTFDYNPADGNLLMTVYETGGSASGSVFLDAHINDSAEGLFSRVYSLDSTTTADGTGTNGWGLVTEFDAAPEPSTYAMMVSGFAFLALRIRRKLSAI